MASDQEIGGQNLIGLITLVSRSHIDVHRYYFELFNAQTCPDLSIGGWRLTGTDAGRSEQPGGSGGAATKWMKGTMRWSIAE